MTIFAVSLAAMAAGLIQTVTGFGGAVFMMLFFPGLFPIAQAAGVAATISLGASGGNAWRYRKETRLKLLIPPAFFYIFTSTAAIAFVERVPADLLKKVFGGFLVILSVYFLFGSGKIKIKANGTSAGICGSLSGLASGLFGIGGPPMVIYFLAATDRKEQYLGSIHPFFFLTGLYALALRLYQGILGADLLPCIGAGLLSVTVGRLMGERIVDRLNAERMKMIIYAFLGLSGLLNLFDLQSLL